MNEAIIIRPVQPEDHRAIFEITAREFPAVASIDARIERMIGGVPWSRIKNARVREELDACPEACAVAVRNDVIVGYITCIIDRTAERGTIANLAVSRDCQGRGIGRRLLEWALALFKNMGLQQAKIETLECNDTGKHLYPRLGFREVVRQIHYVMPLK